jgi:hypothetical protein
MFERLHAELLAEVRRRVRNGDLTERRLGKCTGISQSHIHNVLKGEKVLSNYFADRVLLHLKINVADLFNNSLEELSVARNIPLMIGRLGQESGEFDPERTEGFVPVPAALAAGLRRPVMARLGRDDETRPAFEANDWVLIDLAANLADFKTEAAYVVGTGLGPRLRYLRAGGGRVFQTAAGSRNSPARWEVVGLQEVRGIVMWVGRSLVPSY